MTAYSGCTKLESTQNPAGRLWLYLGPAEATRNAGGCRWWDLNPRQSRTKCVCSSHLSYGDIKSGQGFAPCMVEVIRYTADVCCAIHVIVGVYCVYCCKHQRSVNSALPQSAFPAHRVYSATAFGAPGGNRTRNPFGLPAFEAGTFASFATSAHKRPRVESGPALKHGPAAGELNRLRPRSHPFCPGMQKAVGFRPRLHGISLS